MATTTPRIVIIGAGIVGCALSDELTARGHRDVTVLDKGPLFRTGGSTSHEPGLVFQVGPDRNLTRLAAATVAKYSALRAQGTPCLRRAGGIEVATTPERLTDLHRRHGWAAAAGVESRMLEPGECATLHPLLDKDRILGGLHVPGDGIAGAVDAAREQARAAIHRGAVFLQGRTVTAVEQRGGRVTGVRCGDELFEADVVFSCAGIWAPLIGRLAGVEVPLVPMVHQYARTNPLRALETIHALESASGRRDPVLPVLRHPDAALHVRPHGHRLGIGAHGHRAMPVAPHELDTPGPGAVLPAERRFTPDDFEPSWAAAAALLPVLGDAKVEDGANGILPATPDGLPLLGEHPDLAGFWTAEGVRLAHSAGIAEAVAEWLTTGRPMLGGEPLDLAHLHIDRFDPATLAPSVVRARTIRAFEQADDVRHPLDPPAVARPVRISPLYSRQVELRAVFTEAGAVERPMWFEANAWLPEVCELTPRRGWTARNWSPIAGAEALVTHRAAGLFDLSPLRRVEITGPAAAELLQRTVTGDVDGPVGQVLPTLLLDAAGGVLTDLTVTRLADRRFLAVVPDRRGVAALRRWGRPGATVTDITEATAAIGLWGPRVSTILDGLVPAEVAQLGRLRAAAFCLGGVPVTGLRISGIGAEGWELICTAADAERLWDVLYVAGAPYGLVAAGGHALEALRIEAGRRVAGIDLSAEHGPDAAGVGDAVVMDKGPFVGRAAVHASRSAGGPVQRLATLVLDDAGAVLHGGEPVHDLPEPRRYSRDPVLLDGAPDLARGPVIGRITVAATGYTTGTSLAHAWLPAERAEPGTRVSVELSGRRLTAEVSGRFR
ncbi:MULTISPECIES: FAD-dependent oxidoreductase [Pseudonocardia]|uniref:4-methylaminobutanoate oxidase (Formaldehyde-forming) n=2 Tax=Pseudonocardia TaxID=1847 RepID=A0A1Y2N2Y2_PSEAH|nr:MULTISPECIES: FAD-dependent oxidoreductase [Pseudonocardia]OSY41822.1 4-methylaminobutanoate oxidase (formaldehyde-forming) [Pseudonocardia autotrophica]TDN71126.1 glycine cleavage system aminomethyltransferase T [Pseudonocardia autotrophica]BBG01796.1 sarcosine dehydrogenase [Pseudonocardia autotrophica]GEC26255.1 sarcosine dehydrogenase [Pseudonocardia saturnea]